MQFHHSHHPDKLRYDGHDPLTWLGRVRWWHLVVHQWVGRGLLMGHHARVTSGSEWGQARAPCMLMHLCRVLAMLLLFHLLAGT